MPRNIFRTTYRTTPIFLLTLISVNIIVQIHYKNIFSNQSLFNLERTKRNLLSAVYFSSPLYRVAITGSSGYIGSRLLDYLRNEKDWDIIGYDRIFPGQASYEISTEQLQSFDVVIYLGGLTCRVMCLNRPNDVQQENVDDIYKLATRMLHSQTLIFASTSAIAEGSGSVPLNEDSPIQSHLLDLYSSSLLRREKTLRQLSFESNTSPQMIGLRLGTVLGLSPSQRIDLFPMALVCQAFLTGNYMSLILNQTIHFYTWKIS